MFDHSVVVVNISMATVNSAVIQCFQYLLLLDLRSL